jgi:hypothetical protein
MWKYNIKMDHRGIGWRNMNWINLTKGADQWWHTLKRIINVRIPETVGNCWVRRDCWLPNITSVHDVMFSFLLFCRKSAFAYHLVHLLIIHSVLTLDFALAPYKHSCDGKPLQTHIQYYYGISVFQFALIPPISSKILNALYIPCLTSSVV